MIDRAAIDRICAALPGMRPAGPPGELMSWKVGEKMFACFGDFEDRGRVAIKCPDTETARMLIEAGIARKAPYFHASWVELDYAATDEDEARHRLVVSYDTVRAGLKASVRAALPAREDA